MIYGYPCVQTRVTSKATGKAGWDPLQPGPLGEPVGMRLESTRKKQTATRQKAPLEVVPMPPSARLRVKREPRTRVPKLRCSRWVGLPERDEALLDRRRKARNKRKAEKRRRAAA